MSNTKRYSAKHLAESELSPMIVSYIQLQKTRIHRMVVDMGLHPLLNYSIICLMYLGMSAALFSHRPRVLIGYVIAAILILSVWNDPQRQDFLKTTFSRRDYYLVRLAENFITMLPFGLALLVSGYTLIALGIFLLAAVMAISSFKMKWQIVLPTPFYRHPFEFIIGFRVSLIFYLIAYFLTYISIRYDNFGIGVFVILATSLLISMFNSNTEDVHYVWIFARKARQFLHYKLRIATLYTLMLNLPILIALSLAYPDRLTPILAIQGFGMIIVYICLLGKYISYPNQMKLIDSWLMGLCIFLPPMALFVLPYFYIKAQRDLQEILP